MKNIITTAALLAAGTALANAVSLDDLTEFSSGSSSKDGSFSVVLSLSADKLETLLKKGESSSWKTSILSYDVASGYSTGIVTNGSSESGKINTSGIYGSWVAPTADKTKYNYGPYSLVDLASLNWDSVTGVGITYSFSATGGSSVALAFSGIDFTTSYKTIDGLKSGSAVAGAINFHNSVKKAWISDEILSEEDAKSYAVAATAVPEPSAFGLLAGIGALALVASRRRRKA